MITKNSTPLLFGTKACSRRPPKPEMTLIAKGIFTLRPGEPPAFLEDHRASLTGEKVRDDDDERRGECVYPGDFADFKLNAEVMLKGTCYTPGGRPLRECGVRFTVGAWSKVLRVVGPRVWTDAVMGSPTSDPSPFTRMPLSYTNSFGGPDSPLNPVGTGYRTQRLPTIEHPGEILRSREDLLPPASFGPVNSGWPQRAAKVGKQYGKKYMEERAPYYAEDFDWAYFHAAPPDQQLKGYLRGDEEISFHNLHPSTPSFSARLPGFRVRAFVKDDAGKFREVPMVLDTLFADLDEGQLTLLWRGIDQVRESDLSDVASVLLTTEPLAEPPAPALSYRYALEEFEKDPIGFEAAKRDVLRLHEQSGGGGPNDLVSGPMKAALGGGKVSPQEQMQQMAGRLAAMPAVSGRPEAVAELQKFADSVANADTDIPPVPFTSKPGVAPSLGLRRTVREMMERFEPVRANLHGKRLSPDAQARLAQIENMPHDPRWPQIDPDYTPPGPLSTDTPGPYRNLADRDLSGQDLRGMDLSHADLNGAVLIKTKLAGARLVGANLRNAVLFKTDLAGADLTGADLTRANAARVFAERANFTGAVLEQTFFEDALLTEAILNETTGEYTAFARADLRRARIQKAKLFRADFEEAMIEEADLSNSSLVGCVFERCHGRKVNLAGARITVANFAQAELQGARFTEARGERAWFYKANLDGADLGWVTFKACHFTEASAVRAKFFGANLRECRFYRACLDEAELVRANLFGADLCKARLTRAKFTGSSLYEAKLLGASGSGCDFTDANLKRSTLERR